MHSNNLLKENYEKVVTQLPEDIQLVAVSKTHDVETVQKVYDLGQRIFGENKVQELISKQPDLPEDIEWHLIGHLQTNKVKYIAEFIHTIQSVDSEKILKEIDKQAAKFSRKIKVLLQIKIAEEDTKYGLDFDTANNILSNNLNGAYPNTEICGLMGMATFTEDQAQVRREFEKLKKFYDQLSAQHNFDTLSMGMSGDYPLAIACGATSVRIGSAIFGERHYDL